MKTSKDTSATLTISVTDDFNSYSQSMNVVLLKDNTYMTAIINGHSWEATTTGVLLMSSYSATSGYKYQRRITGYFKEANIGDISRVDLGLSERSSPYDVSTGSFERNSGLGFGSVCISYGSGGCSTQKTHRDIEESQATLNITSVENGFIEGTFSFEVHKYEPDEGEYKLELKYRVTNGKFRIKNED